MNPRTLTLLVAVLATTAGGCATISKGTTQSISFNSSPSGATVVVNGSVRGQTPTVIALARSRDHSGQVYMPGYQPVAFRITRRPTNAIFGNILIGGLIGAAVDGASGANNDLSPESITITLLRE